MKHFEYDKSGMQMRLQHELYIPRTEMRAWLPVLGGGFDLAVHSLMGAECVGHNIRPDCMPHMQAWRRRSMGAVVPKARRVCMDRVWTRGDAAKHCAVGRGV